ncbi:Histone-lysine N-methyltransferase NSD3 [Chamberlinius hualienensis]
MNGTEDPTFKQNSSQQSQQSLVGNRTNESVNNERPSSPSNLVIVSVTCCANEIWDGSSNSSNSAKSETSNVSDTVSLSKGIVKSPELKPISSSNQIPPIRIIVNKRSKMPVVPNKTFIVPAPAISKEIITVVSEATPNKSPDEQLPQLNFINLMGSNNSKDVVHDTKTESNQTTNHIQSDETDAKPNGAIIDDELDHKNDASGEFKSISKISSTPDITPTSAEITLTTDSISPTESSDEDKNTGDNDNVINENSDCGKSEEPLKTSGRKRPILTKLPAERRVSQRQQNALKLKQMENEKWNELQNIQNISEISEEPLPIPPLTSPQIIKRRYMRKIIPDELQENLTSSNSVTSTTSEEIQPMQVLDTTETVTKSPVRKKKGFHRLRDLEDLVWVKISGRPWWPAQVTLDPQSNAFRRNKISPKRASCYMAEYHITTLGESPASSWVLANYLLDFRGKKQFEDYVTQLKRPVPVNTPLYAQIKWRFHVKETIREEWEKVVKETEDNYKTAIQEQREKDLQIPIVPRKIRKRFCEPSEDGKFVNKKRKMTSDDEKPEKDNDSTSSINHIQKATTRKRKPTVLEETAKLDSPQNGKENTKKMCKWSLGKNKGGKKIDDTFEMLGKGSKLRNLLTKKKGKVDEVKNKSQVSQLNENGLQKKKSKVAEDSTVVAENSSIELETVSPTKPKSRKQSLTSTKKSVDRNVEKVCHICEVMIMNNEPTVRCHGICKSVVHVACAIPPPASDVPVVGYKCETCITGNHVCFICKKNDGDIMPCRANYCGKLYHAACLEPFRSSRIDEQTVLCPAHACMSCTLSYSIARPFNGNRSLRCIRCPFAYHAKDACLPAGSLILSNSVIICPKHHSPKPARRDRSQHVNVNWCFVCSNGGSLICCESCPASFHAECLNIEPPEGNYYCCECLSGMQPKYGDIVWVKLGNYRWWPAKICNPKNVPINIRNLPHHVGEFPVCFFGTNDFHWTSRSRVFHFLEGDQGAHITSSSSSSLAKRFQMALAEACEGFKEWKAARDVVANRYNKSTTQPPYYKHILTNRTFGKTTTHSVNLSMMTPCDCNPNSEYPCGSDTECLNRMLMFECHPGICLAGERCNNQRFQKREYPTVETFLSEGKGWGLRCLMDIKKGDFVNEYVGEIIDENECRRRMKKMHEENNTSYYFLTIDKDRIIDAAHKGNLSRFMNHSCRPNNETRKWTVNGDTRVGLFALCDIPSGTELTFNYNLDCLGNEKILCKCGEPNCSIYIGERPKVLKPSSKKKSDTVRKKRKKSRISKVEHDDLCFRCGEDGHLVLCDRKGCTKAFHLDCLDMKKTPHGRWECPWHHCYHCGKPSSALCLICPNSFCKDHEPGNINILQDGSIYCNDHNGGPGENTNEAFSTEIRDLDHKDTVAADDELSPENSETNSISYPPVKVNGAKVFKKVNKNSTSTKRQTTRKRKTSCKTSEVEKDEDTEAKVERSKEFKTEEEIHNANTNGSNSVNDENKPVVDLDSLPLESKLNPVKRRWRTSAVKNGIITTKSETIVKVTTRSRTQNQLIHNQLVNGMAATIQTKAKLQLDRVEKTEIQYNNEKLQDVKTSLQELETDKESTIIASTSGKSVSDMTFESKVDKSELEAVENKVNEEQENSQIHCQDITM